MSQTIPRVGGFANRIVTLGKWVIGSLKIPLPYYQITQLPDFADRYRDAVVGERCSDAMVLPTRSLSAFDQRVTMTRSFSQSM